MEKHKDGFPRVRRRSPWYALLNLLALGLVILVSVFTLMSWMLPNEGTTIDLDGSDFRVNEVSDTEWTFFGFEDGCLWWHSRKYVAEGIDEEGKQRTIKVCQGPSFIGATLLEDLETVRD